MSKRIVVLRGISGSGKSTVARQLAANEPGAIIVSADDYFETPEGYKWAADKLNAAHGQCFRLFMAAIQADAPLIVVDNTNQTALEISPYMLAAQAYGYESAIVDVRCDPKVAAVRATHGVPESVIEQMASRMEQERLAPWWQVIQLDAGVEAPDGGDENPG
jgi:tRNA uridine 5-carbamoylmethylation protein Kti12